MDATLGENCVNDVCPVLKSQTAEQAAKCSKETQVGGEIVGRNGECTSPYFSLLSLGSV
jgi:hypothetical protein